MNERETNSIKVVVSKLTTIYLEKCQQFNKFSKESFFLNSKSKHNDQTMTKTLKKSRQDEVHQDALKLTILCSLKQ